MPEFNDDMLKQLQEESRQRHLTKNQEPIVEKETPLTRYRDYYEMEIMERILWKDANPNPVVEKISKSVKQYVTPGPRSITPTVKRHKAVYTNLRSYYGLYNDMLEEQLREEIENKKNKP